MMQPFAGIIAYQLTKRVATSALPGAPVLPEPTVERGRPRRVRRAGLAR